MNQVNQIIYDYLKNRPEAVQKEIKEWILRVHKINLNGSQVIRGCIRRFRKNKQVSPQSLVALVPQVTLPPSKLEPQLPQTNKGESGLCLSDLRNFWNAVQQIGGRKIAKELLEMAGE